MHAYSKSDAVYVGVGSNGGDVVVGATHGNATGVVAASDLGSTVTIDGNVTVMALTAGYAAIGIDASALDGGAYVHVNNGVLADAVGDATGVLATGDDVKVFVGDDVVAYSKLGNATGVNGNSTGYAGVTVDGNVVASALAGNATGVAAQGGLGGFYADVTVGGNVTAQGKYFAAGVDALSSGYVHVSVKGYVTSVATAGNAYGVIAETGQGYHNDDVNVSIGQSVAAMGAVGAFAVEVEAGGDGDIAINGNVTAESNLGEAVGVGEQADGNAKLYVGGNITVMSTAGRAYGAVAEAGGNVSILVDGGVTAQSVTGYGAVGVFGASVGDNVAITINGAVLVEGDIADGVVGESLGGGTVSVDVGNVTVHQYAGSSANNSGAGIRTYTTGVTTIDADDIVTTGDWTDGIKAGGNIGGGLNGGNSYVTVDDVSTFGNHSFGVYVVGQGNATVVSTGEVYTKGSFSDGIVAEKRD